METTARRLAFVVFWSCNVRNRNSIWPAEPEINASTNEQQDFVSISLHIFHSLSLSLLVPLPLCLSLPLCCAHFVLFRCWKQYTHTSNKFSFHLETEWNRVNRMRSSIESNRAGDLFVSPHRHHGARGTAHARRSYWCCFSSANAFNLIHDRASCSCCANRFTQYID